MHRQGFRKKPRQGSHPRNVYRRGPLPGRFGSQMPLGSEVACAVKAQCGTCKFVNLDYQASLDEKVASGRKTLADAGLLATARVLPAVPSPRPLEYRSLFKLAVRPARDEAGDLKVEKSLDPLGAVASPRRFKIGLFAVGSHEVLDMDGCPLHTPPLRRLLQDLRTELEVSPLTPYDETSGSGDLRYIAARAAHLTGELMLTFVVTHPFKLELRRIVQTLQRRGHKINSAHMNLHPEASNAIFGPKTERLAGADGLRERLCDLDFVVGPTSFFQINPWQAINLYRRVESVAGAAHGASAWDLYCGTGQISLILARLGYRTLGIEENPDAISDAKVNAKRNHLDDKAQFIASRVEEAQPLIPQWAQSPALIVANPSRRGLAESTRRHLAMMLASNPQARLVYVSCDVESLARDLKHLTELTGFQLRQAEPFDMFPQTSHTEWLAVLSRQ